MTIKLTPLTQLRVSRHQIPSYHFIPNTSIQRRPLTIYHDAFIAPSSTAIENHLRSVGVVTPHWKYSMYPTTHFHSSSHEVLCVFSGSARLCFGGEDNDGRVEYEAKPGDVIIVPAGVGHRLLWETGDGFEMVGSYPVGFDWDMCFGSEEERVKVQQRIGALEWFKKDPVYGDKGPVLAA